MRYHQINHQHVLSSFWIRRPRHGPQAAGVAAAPRDGRWRCDHRDGLRESDRRSQAGCGPRRRGFTGPVTQIAWVTIEPHSHLAWNCETPFLVFQGIFKLDVFFGARWKRRHGSHRSCNYHNLSEPPIFSEALKFQHYVRCPAQVSVGQDGLQTASCGSC